MSHLLGYCLLPILIAPFVVDVADVVIISRASPVETILSTLRLFDIVTAFAFKEIVSVVPPRE